MNPCLARAARAALLSLCALMPAGVAAGEFSFSGSLRLRQEVLDGQYRPGAARTDDLLASRLILSAGWKQGPWSLGAEVYDSRALAGESRGVLTTGEVNALEPVQLYAQRDFLVDDKGRAGATVKLGRFDLSLGSRRLVSSDDYRNTSSGYTGIKVDLRPGPYSLTGFFTLPQQRLPEDNHGLRHAAIQLDHEGFDTQLWGLVAARSGLAHGLMAEVGYVGFHERDTARTATRDRELHNLTARLIRQPQAGQWDYEFEGIVQRGRIRTGTTASAPLRDVAAGFVHAELARTFTDAWKSRVSLEYDIATGDGPGAHYGRFDTLYGMRRTELAPSGIYGAVGRANMETIGLRLEMTPSKRTDAFTMVRAMWGASPTDSFSTSGLRDATGAAGSFAGYQIEARVRHWLIPQRLRGELSGVTLLKGELLRRAPNAPPWGDTVYLAAALTLEF